MNLRCLFESCLAEGLLFDVELFWKIVLLSCTAQETGLICMIPQWKAHKGCVYKVRHYIMAYSARISQVVQFTTCLFVDRSTYVCICIYTYSGYIQYMHIAPSSRKTFPGVLVTKVAFWSLHPTRTCETMGAEITVVSSLLVVNAPTGSIHLPWEPTTLICRAYNPYIGGSKPSFFMVLGSKGIYIYSLGGGFKRFLIFTPSWWNDPIWLVFFFSNGWFNHRTYWNSIPWTCPSDFRWALYSSLGDLLKIIRSKSAA